MTDILKNVSIEQLETAITKALEAIAGDTLSVELKKIEYPETTLSKKHADIQMVVQHRTVQQEGGDPIPF